MDEMVTRTGRWLGVSQSSSSPSAYSLLARILYGDFSSKEDIRGSGLGLPLILDYDIEEASNLMPYSATIDVKELSTYKFEQGGQFRKLHISVTHAGNHVVVCTVTASASSAAAGSSTSYSEGQVTTIDFILDSGASSHVIGDRSLFTFYREIDYASLLVRPVIRVANGTELPILGYGTVQTGSFTIPNVLYVPGVVKNVISCSRLTSMDYNVLLTRDGCSIVEVCNGDKVGEGRMVGGLYHMEYLKLRLDRPRCEACVGQEARVEHSEGNGGMEPDTSQAR